MSDEAEKMRVEARRLLSGIGISQTAAILDNGASRIAELEQQLAELREAARYTMNAWDADNMNGTGSGIDGIRAALEVGDGS